MVASANGVVAWRRRDGADDPVRAILGAELGSSGAELGSSGSDERPERIADRRLMRLLRSFGDVAVGAQTVRDQPNLLLTPQEPGDEPAPELYAFREARGLSHHPRNVIYSLFGRLPLEHPIFNTPGLVPIVVTSALGGVELVLRGARDHALTMVVEVDLGAAGLRRANERLFAEHDVRYLACEGGETILRALHGAGLLDEIFVTSTDVVIDVSAHDHVLTIFDFEAEGARLLAEGKISAASGYTFRRWRFARR